MRHFETGATRDSDESKLDYEGFLSPAVLKSYAEYMHTNRIQADGNLRDSDNWQKGIPRDAYMKSMFRHFMEVWEIHRGVVDGDIRQALNAMLFNVMGYLHEELKEDNDSYTITEKGLKALAEHRFGNLVLADEETLRYEDIAPSHHTPIRSVSSMVGGEVLGFSPVGPAGEVAAVASEVRGDGCGEEAVLIRN